MAGAAQAAQHTQRCHLHPKRPNVGISHVTTKYKWPPFRGREKTIFGTSRCYCTERDDQDRGNGSWLLELERLAPKQVSARDEKCRDQCPLLNQILRISSCCILQPFKPSRYISMAEHKYIHPNSSGWIGIAWPFQRRRA